MNHHRNVAPAQTKNPFTTHVIVLLIIAMLFFGWASSSGPDWANIIGASAVGMAFGHLSAYTLLRHRLR